MTVTSRTSKGVNLIVFLYHRAQKHQKKITFFSFFPCKGLGTKFDLAIKKSRSTQGHHLYKLERNRSPDDTYQVSRQSALKMVLEKKF